MKKIQIFDATQRDNQDLIDHSRANKRLDDYPGILA